VDGMIEWIFVTADHTVDEPLLSPVAEKSQKQAKPTYANFVHK
jgi:hypothetical protein